MHFELHHRFDHPVEAVWTTLFSPGYVAAASSLSDIQRSVERDEVRDGVQFVRTRCTSPRELPPVVRRAIGADRIVYHLEEIRDHANHSLRWRVLPGALAEKVKAEGSFALRATPTGCERLVKGEVRVAIPLVGSKIESGIGRELQAGYEKAAELTRRWLKENR
ncbi:MAG: DUF2505 domain-containing protein [Myxococcota bacterium]|nr:DUF2505 domain-containing protein [Myxococcota bacterium]